MEKGKKQNTLLILSVFIIILVILLAVIVFMILRALGISISLPKINSTPNTTTETKTGEIVEIGSPIRIDSDTQYNYNFALADYTGSGGQKDELITDDLVVQTKQIINPINSKLSRIKIAKIGVNAPIIQDLDGNKAIDLGWWLYPGSKQDGEKILMAHRRFWKAGHPFSAWNINTLKKGTLIQLVDKSGSIFKYKIVSQSVVQGNDLSIFNTANDDLLKIITCSTFTGDAGSSSHRFITIAKRV